MNAASEAIRGSPIGIFQPSRERLERLGAWFEAEYSSLLRFAYFVTGDRDVAEDLVQDAFVRIYRAGARVEEESIGAYARRTLVNLSRSRFRRATLERRPLPRDDRAAADPADVLARDDVWRALLTLSPRQRAVVALRYYEDLSERDIAQALEMSVGAVKKQTHRAMTKLRAQLGDRRQL
jgi:RNA polymerase sigma-70 factor (sigma-E family)